VKVRTYLLIFALAILVPMLAFAAIAVVAFDRQQRALVERGGVETARALMNALDRELEGTITTLRALATARSLERDDLAMFYEDARRVLASQQHWFTITLVAPSGQRLMDLVYPYGSDLPPLRERETFELVVRTGRPAVGPITFGPLIGRYAVPIRVPILRGGRVAYVLTGVIEPAAIEEILRRQQIPSDWVGTVFDSRRAVVARTRGADPFVGKPVSPEFARALETAREGWTITHTLEGAAVYTAFSRSDATGWGVGLGIPPSAVDGPLRRSLWTIAGGGVAFLVAAVALSVLVGQRIARPIVALSTGAKAFAEGSDVALVAPTGGPAEVDAVSRAFVEGSVLLRTRAAERDEALALIDTLVAGAPVGLAFIDLGGRYRRVNAAFAAMAGLSIDEHLGRSAEEVLPAVARDVETHVGHVLSTRQPVTDVELTVAAPGSPGVTRSWRMSFYPVATETRGTVGVGCIAVEVTEQRRVEQERADLLARAQEARTEAEAANRAKDEFLAVLSHELRTPLNAVYGWARMLRTSDVDAATTRRALDVIDRNASAQLRLIDDLLDVSRVVTGNMRLDVTTVDLRAVVEAALDSVRPAATAKNIALKVLHDPESTPVVGDADRLQQVVWNLLSNSIKFTPAQGRVQVQVRRVGAYVEIVVSDTGLGIEPRLLPYVFDRFRQADSTSTRPHGGLGLGLALVRHLVELHGGEVTVSSDGEGHGATFVVRLPVSTAV
jgi:PAS domain S-box-containing protein